MACGKLDIKPSNYGVNEVIAPHFDGVRLCEGQVGDCDCVEVECDDWGGIGGDSFDVDCVNKRLRKSRLLEWCVVEAPYVVPDCDIVS